MRALPVPMGLPQRDRIPGRAGPEQLPQLQEPLLEQATEKKASGRKTGDHVGARKVKPKDRPRKEAHERGPWKTTGRKRLPSGHEEMTNDGIPLEEIRKVVEVHRASEDAAFAVEMERELWKNLGDTARGLAALPEKREGETPYVESARMVSLRREAMPGPDEGLINQAERILELQKRWAEATRRGGSHERMERHCRNAHALAAEFAGTLVVDPDLKGGKPCVRGLRISAFDVLELLAEGKSPEEILDEEPLLNPADIADCVQFAIRMGELAEREADG